MNDKLLVIVNQVRANKALPLLPALESTDRLREDLGFESLDLAELTVRIEEEFGVDVFADGLVNTVGEIHDRLTGSRKG
ncbi:MAG: acyl carrier protein [Candidatus Didemnitutus sp.]|nr:acyl carrier protein [Candidatus Didemnitutus sp.]